MKIKGLAEAQKALEKLGDNIQEKIDSIGWEGETTREQEKDQQKSEYYDAAFDIIDAAIDSLSEIEGLKLEDF